MYAFYHVFKASDYRVEQLTDVSIGIDVELFWFSWSPPRAAHYELSVRVDIDNCTGALLHLESNRCQPAAYTAVKVSFRAQYADKITPIYARTDISTCDLSDMTSELCSIFLFSEQQSNVITDMSQMLTGSTRLKVLGLIHCGMFGLHLLIPDGSQITVLVLIVVLRNRNYQNTCALRYV